MGKRLIVEIIILYEHLLLKYPIFENYLINSVIKIKYTNSLT